MESADVEGNIPCKWNRKESRLAVLTSVKINLKPESVEKHGKAHVT